MYNYHRPYPSGPFSPMYYHRAPRRFIWFALGAATATWWIKHKDSDRHSFTHCIRRPPVLAPRDDTPPPTNVQPWLLDQEKEHLQTISRQATDAMAELTEATLESVLSTAESLKAKLAEHRAQREAQQKIIDQQQPKSPPRLV